MRLFFSYIMLEFSSVLMVRMPPLYWIKMQNCILHCCLPRVVFYIAVSPELYFTLLSPQSCILHCCLLRVVFYIAVSSELYFTLLSLQSCILHCCLPRVVFYIAVSPISLMVKYNLRFGITFAATFLFNYTNA